MDSLFISLPLPKNIKNELQRLCFGLPDVQWTDHQYFHLTLLFIGPVDGSIQLDIQDSLEKLRFSPFSLFLQGVGHFLTKKPKGVIWAGVEPSEALFHFKKTIEGHLKDILPKLDNKTFVPHVTLGRFENMNKRRLADYLDSNSFFLSQSFMNDSFALIKSSHTLQGSTVYEELIRFKLEPKINKLRILKD